MDYFSEVTQSTLSAFHKAGIDTVINEEIDLLKQSFRTSRALVLKDAIPLQDNLIKRIFVDDSSDVVAPENLYTPKMVAVNLESKANIILSTALGGELSPISKLSQAKHRHTLECDRRPINRISEQLFFF